MVSEGPERGLRTSRSANARESARAETKVYLSTGSLGGWEQSRASGEPEEVRLNLQGGKRGERQADTGHRAGLDLPPLSLTAAVCAALAVNRGPNHPTVDGRGCAHSAWYWASSAEDGPLVSLAREAHAARLGARGLTPSGWGSRWVWLKGGSVGWGGGRQPFPLSPFSLDPHTHTTLINSLEGT